MTTSTQTCLPIELTPEQIRNRYLFLFARNYDPSIGRFSTLDPFAGNPNDPQSLHKYTYAHDNPIMGIDPSGEELSLTGKLITAGIIGSLIALHTVPQFRNPSAHFGSVSSSVFVPVTRSKLKGTYNSVIIKGGMDADELFSQLTQFSSLNMYPVVTYNNINSLGDVVSFDMRQLGAGLGDWAWATFLELGQGDFQVMVTKYSKEERLVVVQTLVGHPLAGWRVWRIIPLPNGDNKIETFSLDHAATRIDSTKIYLGGLEGQLLTWKNMLTDIVNKSGGEIVSDSTTSLEGRVMTQSEINDFIQIVD